MIDEGRKKSDNLTTRQKRFVAEKVKGKTDKHAAVTAGYAVSTAENTSQKLMKKPAVRNEFQRLFNKALPEEKLVACIVAGIDANETQFFQYKGIVTDSRDVIAWGERRAYAELACRIKQVIPNPNDREVPQIQIHIIDVDMRRENLS